jgi:lipase ATG15
MKVSVYLKYIITNQNLFTPNKMHMNTIPYTFDTLSNNLSTNNLPINFNTIQTMIMLSYNAYFNINDTNWVSTPHIPTNITIDPLAIKGYLFTDESKQNSIIAIKGTSINLLSMLNNTIHNDKYNDNLFFSCCFYKENNIFKNYTGNCDNSLNSHSLTCNKYCYKDSLTYDFNYINSLNIIVNNIKKFVDFDNSNVVFTGHSLGGFLATIAGIKYNKQVITFDTPGSKHYFDLIQLDYTNKDKNIYNFGHTADSIMHGHCGTICKTWGYDIETECHIGNTCIYDSKKKLGYFDSIRYHQLKWIIDYILPKWDTDFPECIYNKECHERNCDKWTFD